MKPTCTRSGHEMVLEDEKECYQCYLCLNEKEEECWWCQSCWEHNNLETKYCFECVSDKGNHQHIIINETVK